MLLLLTACHVFSSLEIPCTAGQPCADGTTKESPPESEPVDEPEASVGLVLALIRGAATEVRVYDPDGSQGKVWSGLAFAGAGAIVYDPASTTAYVATSSGYARLDSATTAITPDLAGPYVDMELLGSRLVLLTTGEIALVAAATGVEALRSTVAYENLDSVTVLGDDAFVVDLQSSGPDLIRVNETGVALHAADIDTDDNRASSLFVGADSDLLVCSGRGIVYAVTSLRSGSSAPLTVCDADLRDVTDCAYDPATDEILLATSGTGLWAMAASGVGACTQRLTPPDGVTVVGSYFYR